MHNFRDGIIVAPARLHDFASVPELGFAKSQVKSKSIQVFVNISSFEYHRVT